jgi:microcystin-dependent protein
MRRWITNLVLLLLVAIAPAAGQVVGGLPFNLQNNTVADASQVMANFNTIVSGVNTNAATAGVNTNITRLSGLTTPITPAQGGTSTYIATATGTGTANAQVVAATNPTFSLTSGVIVQWVPVGTNTAATTLNVGGTGAIAINRPQLTGFSPLAGGELVSSSTMQVMYDGTRYVLLTPQNTAVPSGVTFFTATTAAPAGYLLLQGQAVSRTTYQTLFNLLGTTFGSGDGLNTFNLPDAQGRYLASYDNGVGRLNGCNSGIFGSACGNQLLPQSALPNVGLSVTVTCSAVACLGVPNNAGSTSLNQSGGATVYDSTRFASISGTTASLNGGVGQTAALPPTLVLQAIIKY